MTYVIHGAAGAQGAPVLAALTASGRDVAALSRHADTTIAGARTVVADIASVDQLVAAYTDAEGVFVHLPLGATSEHARSIVAALAAARPARIVISTSGQIVDDPASPLSAPEGSPIRLLIDGVAAAELHAAVIAPRLFLENLLLPPVLDGLRADGRLRYPLAESLPVSWSSHRDNAEVVAALFASDVTGIVGVGHLPALRGVDLAAAFAEHLGQEVAYEPVSPESFGESIRPILGDHAAIGVTGLYSALATIRGYGIEPQRSAQQLLGVAPRSLREWLPTTGL